MARVQFEEELLKKLEQKTSARLSEETILLRAFKYFDLDNSGTVSLDEWLRALEKIGILIVDRGLFERYFREYDLDQSGSLDYKEFSAVICGTKPKVAPVQYRDQQRVEEVLEAIRAKLATRGARGIIGLGRQFRLMDDDNSGDLSYQEFATALTSYRIGVSDEDLTLIFKVVDRDQSGSVNYDEFLRSLRGTMNSFRKNLVTSAFNKLDRDGSGVIDIRDLADVYNARSHPEVRSGQKTEEAVLNEFLETFETHHNLTTGARDHRVTPEEFEEYYNNVSASIDNDQHFELLMNNAWKLTEAPAYTRNKGWTNTQEQTQTFGQRPTREKAGYSSEGITTAYKRVPVKSAAPALRTADEPQQVIDRFRQKLAARGGRGILGLQRQFKIMDDDNSKQLSLAEFRKGCKDFRIDVSDAEIEDLFRITDRDGSGQIDYDELLRTVRGPMNDFRKALVHQAWRKLDRDGSGVVDVDEIREMYSARQHPAVRSGKKTEDEVLGEFLETFEMHHNIRDRSQLDHRVTREEFEEYYNNISGSIDDDRYFEEMMNTAWRLKGGSPVKAAWTNSYESGQPTGRASWMADHHRSMLGGSVSSTAPFGTSDVPTDWSTSLRPRTSADNLLNMAQQTPAAGVPTWPGQSKIYNVGSRPQTASASSQSTIKALREKLALRGARGIIGLGRQFRIMDDDGSRKIEYPEFAKAMRDYRLEFSDAEVQQLFTVFDTDRSGSVDYEEFLGHLRGPLNERRKQLVLQAYAKLDRTGDGIVDIEDLRGVYDSSNHPDVKMGKKSKDEVLFEFLDTFEMHHEQVVRLTQTGSGRDHRVTQEEFLTYYEQVSASIDDDRYFELMIKNAWNLEGRSYERGWAGDNTAPPTRSRH
jgi:Ca2+-binding EF-hand superfamily protein